MKNTFNGIVWQLNNTPTTNPPIFEWVNVGFEVVAQATQDTLGITKGSSSISILSDGSANVATPILNDVSSAKSEVARLEDDKLDKSAVVQELGSSATDVMSQNAVSNQLALGTPLATEPLRNKRTGGTINFEGGEETLNTFLNREVNNGFHTSTNTLNINAPHEGTSTINVRNCLNGTGTFNLNINVDMETSIFQIHNCSGWNFRINETVPSGIETFRILYSRIVEIGNLTVNDLQVRDSIIQINGVFTGNISPASGCQISIGSSAVINGNISLGASNVSLTIANGATINGEITGRGLIIDQRSGSPADTFQKLILDTINVSGTTYESILDIVRLLGRGSYVVQNLTSSHVDDLPINAVKTGGASFNLIEVIGGSPNVGGIVRLTMRGGNITAQQSYIRSWAVTDNELRWTCEWTDPSGLINHPHLWAENVEVNLGNGLFGRKVSGTIGAAANVFVNTAVVPQQATRLRLVDAGGWWQAGAPDFYPINQTVLNDNGVILCSSNIVSYGEFTIGCRTMSTIVRQGSNHNYYDIWVKYTKA